MVHSDFRRVLRRVSLGWVLSCLCFSPALFANQGSEALQQAAEDGDVPALEQLLRAEQQVNQPMLDGSTALHWAALRDRPQAVEFLLQHGGDVAARNRNGVFPLYLAALNGSEATTALLLDAGADANATLPNGETVLMTAARTGSPAVIELLLAHGAQVDARDPEYQQTALMIAARENHPEAVATLLRYGAEVNSHTRLGPMIVHLPPCKGTGCGSEGVGINRSGVPDRGERYEQKGGMTALLYAAREGNVAVARTLLDAGAKLEQTEANGIGPLLMALLNNQLEAGYLLLEHGAEVNVSDYWGRSPLFASVDYRNLELNSSVEDSPTTNHVDREPIFAMIERLLQAGADVNARTTEWPPEKKWLYALNDVTWVDMTGQTPFLRAAFSGDVRVMQLLLDHGADPSLTTYAGTTALMVAAGVNWTVAQTYTESDASSLDAARLCLSLGADVNATNSMGLTALLGASNRGFNDMIELLADNGARLDVQDAAGRTALRWAEGVFLAAVGAQQKPETIALLKTLMDERGLAHE
ncbi:MAG TPA: ankyrin repeat domain-containing protein [Hyphomicrobiales bacterium]|nr:ankyrin repeat domain-containing protein [Hyphomicrobiales bacterium]